MPVYAVVHLEYDEIIALEEPELTDDLDTSQQFTEHFAQLN